MAAMGVRDPNYYCGGAGCGGILLVLAVGVVVGGGLAYRHGPHWPYMLLHRHAPGVIIHHSGTGATAGGRIIDADLLDVAHAQRGWAIADARHTYHIGYHYVILPDGTVQRGRPEWMPGAHTAGKNRYLGICLVGNFSSKDNPDGTQKPSRPTAAQLETLASLLKELMKRHGFSPDDVHGHDEFRATECPGDRCPMDRIRLRLAEETSRM